MTPVQPQARYRKRICLLPLLFLLGSACTALCAMLPYRKTIRRRIGTAITPICLYVMIPCGFPETMYLRIWSILHWIPRRSIFLPPSRVPFPKTAQIIPTRFPIPEIHTRRRRVVKRQPSPCKRRISPLLWQKTEMQITRYHSQLILNRCKRHLHFSVASLL